MHLNFSLCSSLHWFDVFLLFFFCFIQSSNTHTHTHAGCLVRGQGLNHQPPINGQPAPTSSWFSLKTPEEFSWSKFCHNSLSELIASFLSLAISASVRFWSDTLVFLSAQTKTLSLPIISTPAHLHSFMLHYLGSTFAHREPAASSSVVEILSLRVLIAASLSLPLSVYFPLFLSSLSSPAPWSASSSLVVPPPHPLTLHPACLFTFSAFSVFSPTCTSLSYLPPLNCLSHSTQTFRPVNPYLLSSFSPSSLLLSSSPPLFSLTALPPPLRRRLIPEMCRIPVVHPPLLHPFIWLPSMLPLSQAGDSGVSGTAHWSNTCHTDDAVWGNQCVCLYAWSYVCLWAFVSDSEKNTRSSSALLPVLLVVACLSRTSPSVSVYVSLPCSVGPTYSQTCGLELDLGCSSSILRFPVGEAC